MNRFAKGMLLGIGVGAATILLLIAVLLWVFTESDNSIVGTGAVDIVSQRLEFQNGEPYVMGTMRNTTSGLRHVIIQASLFHTNGAFIDKRDEYVNLLSPQETFPFKIGFYQDGRANLGTNLDYTLKITQGSTE